MGNNLLGFKNELNTETELLMGRYNSREEAFTEYVIEEIEEIIDVGDIQYCYGSIKRIDGNILGEVYAYALSKNKEVLSLFYTLYDNSTSNEIKRYNNNEFQAAVNRLEGFFKYSMYRFFDDEKKEHPLYHAGNEIDENLKTITTVRLYILSNGYIPNERVKPSRLKSKTVFVNVWDINMLYHNIHKGIDHLAIDVNIKDDYPYYNIPFIEMHSNRFGYKCLLCLFPGKLLYNLYEEHNTDLLLSNVRFFLGFKKSKKNANTGIRETLINEPDKFLAFNNGITAIASGYEYTQLSDQLELETKQSGESSSSQNNYISTGILHCIKDFRIVNGGQTTASIFYAKKKDPKLSLDGVFIQAKIIILDETIKDQEKGKMASDVTKNTNTQSPIKYSDFSVSNAYNTTLEELSRNIQVPNDAHRPLHWYFERVRGQYDQDYSKKHTGADQINFKTTYPKHMRFKKEEVAKVWKSWDGTPGDAVKGEGTNYDLFINDIVKRNYIPTETYFKETIALLIIYRFLLSRPENKSYGNKKASVVCYTLAYLNYISFGRIDLMHIWEQQELDDQFKIFLNQLAESIKESLEVLAGEIGVLSYGKRANTFNELTKLPINYDHDFINTLARD